MEDVIRIYWIFIVIPNTWNQTLPGAWGHSDLEFSDCLNVPFPLSKSVTMNSAGVHPRPAESSFSCRETLLLSSLLEPIWIIADLYPEATCSCCISSHFISLQHSNFNLTGILDTLWPRSAEEEGVLAVCLGWEAGWDVWVMNVSTGDNLFFSLNLILWLIWSSSAFLSRTCT